MTVSTSHRKPLSALSLLDTVDLHGLIVLVLGLAMMFVPTYIELAKTAWSTDAHSHGPMILAVAFWLLWYDRQKIFESEAKPKRKIGFSILLIAGLMNLLGTSQSINMLTSSAQPMAIAGSILLLHGSTALKRAWFPIFFMLFAIPLPEVMVQTITMPLKHAVSVVSTNLMYWIGYPIARNGVVISIGQYQLLVADACSGLNSLLTLECLGLLYMRLMNYKSMRRNLFLAISIIPISFAANVTRVVILILVTYYFGDEVGQGFVHGFSGMVLFAVSMIGIYMVDMVYSLLFGSDKQKSVVKGVAS